MTATNPLLDKIVLMRRPSLEDLPPIELPDGCDLRVFCSGDEGAWEQVVGEAFGRDDRDGLFARAMRDDPEYFDADSIFMIWKADQPVATASAWLRNAYGPEAGYLHKVAVACSERGRGLGYQASLVCLHKMAADGRTCSVLRTQVKRIPAVKTYLKLGFEPWILEDEHHRNWEEVWSLIKG